MKARTVFRTSPLLLVSLFVVLAFAEASFSPLGKWINSRSDEVACNVLIEVETVSPFGSEFSSGSGVVVTKDGLVVTAAHVLEGATLVRVKLHDGRMFDFSSLSMMYVDKIADVGYIDLPLTTNRYAPLGERHNLMREGSRVYSVGNPEGVLEDVVSFGKVIDESFQRLYTGKNVDHILARMKGVVSGFSGGGVYWEGRLVGIVTRTYKDKVVILKEEECRMALERYAASKR